MYTRTPHTPWAVLPCYLGCIAMLDLTHGCLILAVTRSLNCHRAWGIIWDLSGKELAKEGMTDVYKVLKAVGKGIGSEHFLILVMQECIES